MKVGYGRTSTAEQNPQLQIDALTAARCERVFIETASGAQRDRPELKAAIEFMRAGDTLCVWRLDRLGRSIKDLIEIVEGLDAREIGFRSLTESIDTTTSGGRLIFHVFGALAEFERSLIRERTRAGLDAARGMGRKGGRPPALTKADLAVARTLLEAGGLTVAEVAKRVGVSAATLYRHLPAARTSAQVPLASPL